MPAQLTLNGLRSAAARANGSEIGMTIGVLGDNGFMQDAITRDSEVMHGTPVFRGTRVPVKTLFDYLENGESLG